jgi:Domain of unknown function (DUF6398)
VARIAAEKRMPKKGIAMTAEFSIPSQVQPAYDAIVSLIDAFCQAHLTQEYQATCRRLAGVLACKHPSPLLRGKPDVWACGILRVIGRVNFLDIDTGRRPFMTLTIIDKRLGVSSNTSQSKAKAIRDMLEIRSFDLDWTLPSLREGGVRRWMLSFTPEYFEVLDREEPVEQAIEVT